MASGSMAISRLNIISVIFYLWLVGLCYIGIVLAKLGVKNYLLVMASEESLNKAYWATSYTLIATPLSMVIYQKLLFGGTKKIKTKIESFYTKKICPLQSKKDSAQLFFWMGLTFIVALAGMYSFSVLPKAPILAILTGASPNEISRLRYISSFGFPGNIYVRNLLFQNLAPLISYIAYGYTKLYTKNLVVKIWFYLTVLLAFLALTFYGDKAPIIIYIITIIIIKGIIDGGQSKKMVFITAISVFSIIMILYLLIDNSVSFNLYGGIFSRLLMVPSGGLMLTFDIFPEVHDFLHGASLPTWFVPIFDLEHVRSARIVMEVINPEGVKAGTSGVINSLFVAEAYANFGTTGLIIAPFVVGFVVQLIYNIIISAPKSPVFITLMGYFIFKFPILGGFVDFIWNVGWILLFIFICISIQARYVLLNLSEK